MISNKNLYTYYYENEMRYGFFIKDETWKQSIAEVLFFKGVKQGEPLKGNPPYFNNPIAYCKLWFVTSKEAIATNTKFKIIKIYDAGTYRYSLTD